MRTWQNRCEETATAGPRYPPLFARGQMGGRAGRRENHRLGGHFDFYCSSSQIICCGRLRVIIIVFHIGARLGHPHG